MALVMQVLTSKRYMAMNKVKVNSDVELKDRLVAINRVTKVTKGGRTFTFAAIVVVNKRTPLLHYLKIPQTYSSRPS